MTNLSEFLESFEGTEFKIEDLKIFYRSVRKSVILSFFNKRALPELLKLEEKCQWPLLQRIADPELPIYQNSDKELLDAFIKSISDEKALRANKSSMDSDQYWRALFALLDGRLELFKSIFNFCSKDMKRCEMVAERYRRSRQRKIEDSKKLWKFGIGAGVTALAGSAALWYFSRKDNS